MAQQPSTQAMRLKRMGANFFKLLFLLHVLAIKPAYGLEITTQGYQLPDKHNSTIHPLEGQNKVIAVLTPIKQPVKPPTAPDTDILATNNPSTDKILRHTIDRQTNATQKGVALVFDTSLQNEVQAIPLSAQINFIDSIKFGGRNTLIAQRQNGGIDYLTNEGAWQHLFELDSVYLGVNEDEIPSIGISRDLNGDEREDLLIPSFDGWSLLLQQDDHSFAPAQIVGLPPHMNLGSSRYVGFRAEEPYLLDYNLDQITDIGFWREGAIHVHLNDGKNNYAAEPIVTHTAHTDVLENFFALTIGEDAENTEGTQRLLESIEDINGDGLDDLVIQKITGEGIFGKETQIEFFYGQPQSDPIGLRQDERQDENKDENKDGLITEQNIARTLSFATQPNSIIASDGVQVETQRFDVNDDGQQELMITSVDIGIGTIVGALLTRSVTLDIGIYQMVDGVYQTKPSIKRTIKASFNLSSGELFIPTLLTADVNGDNLQDLLVQRDNERLDVYLGNNQPDNKKSGNQKAGANGTKSPKLFATKPITFKLNLPKTRSGYQAVDLNNNGRDELVLKLERGNKSYIEVVSFIN